jgi:transposase
MLDATQNKHIIISMKYTIKDLRHNFPDDAACLQLVFDYRYGDLKTCPKCGTVGAKFYRIKTRMSFKCSACKQHIYPLKGTIFEKSTTPLTDWFHALYLLSVSKNGVSALEIQRQVGVAYKTAHRMAKMIRILMHEGGKIGFLDTPIEVDEAYIGGKRKQSDKDRKTPVMAALEVGGHVRIKVVPRASSAHALPFLEENVLYGSMVHTDESKIYKHLQVKQLFKHESVAHIANEFVRNGVTTNHVEGFFGQLKRSLDGTYHAVSPYYLGSYVSEFAYRYNHRHETIFPLLLAKAGKRA